MQNAHPELHVSKIKLHTFDIEGVLFEELRYFSLDQSSGPTKRPVLPSL